MFKKITIILIIIIIQAIGLYAYSLVEQKIETESQSSSQQPFIILNSNSFIKPDWQDNPGLNHNVGIPILLYHGVLNQIQLDDQYNISTQRFKEHMQALKDNGYTAIDTYDLLAFIQGTGGMPDKPVMITFDDGRRDSVVNSDSIFRELGFKAVMFVVTKKQADQDSFFLSWEELNLMHQSGRWDIQAHGFDYHDLIVINAQGEQGNFASNKKWLAQEDRLETGQEYKQRLFSDMPISKQDLEENIPGLKIIAFAFPFGDYGKSGTNMNPIYSIRVNKQAVSQYYSLSFGYNTGNTDTNFLYYPSSNQIHTITRLRVYKEWSGGELLSYIEDCQK